MAMINLESLKELCTRCSTIDIAGLVSGKNDTGDIALDHFQSILKNVDCVFCMLIIRALSADASGFWEPGKYPTEMCYLRKSTVSTQLSLETWFTATSKTFPKGVTGHYTTHGYLSVISSAFDEHPTIGKCTPTRLIGEQLDYSLIKSWMKECKSHHGPKCNPKIFDGSDSPPLLLVDVQRMRLIEGRWDCRYVALSYVWGNVEQFRTMRSNFQELQQDGALSRVRGKLPRVISDTIDFVVAFGETHLWVDALCIVQDHASSREECIGKMSKIYSQALLTIIALHGVDANSPLPGINDTPRRPSQEPMRVGSLSFLAEPPILSTVEHLSTWRSRAWTFQEGILSLRTLSFSDHQVYWHCPSSYRSESGFEDRGRCKLTLRRENSFDKNDGDNEQQFYVYRSLVMGYSSRTLTYPCDSLRAFAGILSAIKGSFAWAFASALPEDCFDLALLWWPMTSCELRPRKASERFIEAVTCKSPTWCWTAWAGHIYWNRWWLCSYAGKSFTLKSNVRSFMIKDTAKLRTIIRHMSLDSDGEASSAQFTHLSSVEGLADNPLPNYTLIFEAASLRTDIYAIAAPRQESHWTKPGSDHFSRGLDNPLWIYDVAGRHCGTIWGLSSWKPSSLETGYEFILLSQGDQDEVTQADVDGYRDKLPPEYPSSNEYYEEIFDTTCYSYKRWWALNIMLVKREGDLVQRVAVGQLHVDAWDSAQQRTRTFLLV